MRIFLCFILFLFCFGCISLSDKAKADRLTKQHEMTLARLYSATDAAERQEIQAELAEIETQLADLDDGRAMKFGGMIAQWIGTAIDIVTSGSIGATAIGALIRKAA